MPNTKLYLNFLLAKPLFSTFHLRCRRLCCGGFVSWSGRLQFVYFEVSKFVLWWLCQLIGKTAVCILWDFDVSAAARRAVVSADRGNCSLYNLRSRRFCCGAAYGCVSCQFVYFEISTLVLPAVVSADQGDCSLYNLRCRRLCCVSCVSWSGRLQFVYFKVSTLVLRHAVVSADQGNCSLYNLRSRRLCCGVRLCQLIRETAVCIIWGVDVSAATAMSAD